MSWPTEYTEGTKVMGMMMLSNLMPMALKRRFTLELLPHPENASVLCWTGMLPCHQDDFTPERFDVYTAPWVADPADGDPEDIIQGFPMTGHDFVLQYRDGDSAVEPWPSQVIKTGDNDE